MRGMAVAMPYILLYVMFRGAIINFANEILLVEVLILENKVNEYALHTRRL